MMLPAAQFFPVTSIDLMFRSGEVAAADAARQADAVADAYAHRLRILEARPLWGLAAIGVVLALQTVVPVWVGVAAVGLCILAGRMLHRAARTRAVRVRDADEEIGIPVPDDMGHRLMWPSGSLTILAEHLGEAPYLPAVAEAVGPYRREIKWLDLAYLELLHEIRRCWVDGDDRA